MASIFQDEKSLLVVTCSFGVAPILAQELFDLGFRVHTVSDSYVETEGTLEDCMRLNLHLRTGHRVLYALDKFRCRNKDDLYTEASQIPWERYLDPDGYFSIDRTIRNPTIRNDQIASLVLKDAIADRMRGRFGRRPNSGHDRTDACIFLFWIGTQATIYLDTTGESLSFRGYRSISSDAPMRESLAAALVLASGWNRQSPFLNPMCGCGTLAIEALWIAQNRPPALFRENFSFMHFSCFEPALWTDLRSEALKRFLESRSTPAVAYASDLDTRMVEATKANAEIAEVTDELRIECCDVFCSPHPPAKDGVAILNPPYGGRIGGDHVTLLETYRSVGAFFAQAAVDGYRGFLFTGDPQLCEEAEMVVRRDRLFYSGDMECHFLEDPRLTEKALRRLAKRNPDLRLPRQENPVSTVDSEQI